jgi:3-deoxy-D-manno-octulosonic acid kinase
MTLLHRQYFQGYDLGARLILSHSQLQQLQQMFAQPSPPACGVLTGRRGITLADLDAIGPVVVKHLARGGLIRHLNRHRYLHWPQNRAEREFRWLETVRRVGVAAPRPIAFASTGRFIGQCWLITAAIPDQRSLIQAAQNETLTEGVCRRVAQQVRALIRQGIWHRDLHPGNVLLDKEDMPYLIDFDKAGYVDNRRLLTARYHKRWTRAIARHRLPPVLECVMTLAAADN